SHIPLGAMRKSERTRFNAVEKDGAITISSLDGKFKASYYKPAGQPQLILLERSKTDDYELLADAWKAANDKARELGWIVEHGRAASFLSNQKCPETVIPECGACGLRLSPVAPLEAVAFVRDRPLLGKNGQSRNGLM